MNESNGVLHSVTSSDLDPHTPRASTPADKVGGSRQLLRNGRGPEAKPKHDNRHVPERNMLSGGRTSVRGTAKEAYKRYGEGRASRSSRLQTLQTSTPITPSLDENDTNDRSVPSKRQREHSGLNQYSVITPEMEATEFTPILSPKPERTSSQDDVFLAGSAEERARNGDLSASIRDQLLQGHTIARSRPSALDASAVQDASLPSPSLSPVTAAASLHNRRGYFEDTGVQPRQGQIPLEKSFSDNFRSRRTQDGVKQEDNPSATSREPSLMDIPLLLDSFEAMPPEMKTYVMYQLLRRCTKQVLHFVAENVNPALKCDFLSLLPPELSQNIVRHLDLKSLCRASQVSKKWRQVVDTDEKIWKSLFDAEGFELPSAELQRAISEGWGWQHGSDPNDYERDISSITVRRRRRSSSTGLASPIALEAVSDSISSIDANSPSTQQRRSKRKAGQRNPPSIRKSLKRSQISSDQVALFDTESLRRHLEEADGPYAAAQAALLAVPNPDVGLTTLRNMHLHKSIYRRHHLISQNWMQDEIKPRHLAFKAHQRHVVTCLQFDAEKILTGSDDTNINVYDTRTGALRARLEGHEGGVWALQYEGSTLVSGSTDRSVRVWDIDKGICTHVFLGHTSTVRCLIILMPTEIGRTPSGRPIIMPKEPIIVTGSRDSTLRVWKLPKPDDPHCIQTTPPQEDTESPYFVRALIGHGHSVRAIAAHGDTLISGSYDSTVRVWKISTGETVHRLQGHNSKVYSVVLDHERKRCISGSMDNLVKIWSLETGNLLFNLEGHSSLVGLLDLQRNRLVSAAADSTLRIWDPDSGQCKNVLSAHTGAITCFQHDGRKVISGADRNLKMWNVQTGEFVRDLLTDLSGVWQVKFDERRCVAAVQRGGLTYIEVSLR